MNKILKILVITLSLILSFTQLNEAKIKKHHGSTRTTKIDSKAVAELKKLLSKSDGMRFGNSQMIMTSAKYIESKNFILLNAYFQKKKQMMLC